MPWGPNQCDKIRTFDEAMAQKIEANNIVFAVHIPLPNKEMSPWFQFMLVILQFDIAFKMYNQIGENHKKGEDNMAHVSPPGRGFQDVGEGGRSNPMCACLYEAMLSYMRLGVKRILRDPKAI